MLTIESLKAFGANTEEGVARCINNEAFYLKMVGMVLNDANYTASWRVPFRQETKRPPLKRLTP